MKPTNNNDSKLFPSKDTKAHINTVKAYSRGVWVEDSELKESLDHVIERAEYSHDLEESLKVSRSNEEYQHDRKHINAERITVLENENKRLCEVVEWYAKASTWNDGVIQTPEGDTLPDAPPFIYDMGEKARIELKRRKTIDNN